MATQIVTTNIIGAGSLATVDDQNALLVTTTGGIYATNDIAVYAGGGQSNVTVLGTIYGAYNALRMGNSAGVDAGSRITVGTTGSILADYNSAIYLHGTGHRVVNDGLISGTYGIEAIGARVSGYTAWTTIVNHGMIAGSNFAIGFTGHPQITEKNEWVSITNTGTISGPNAVQFTGWQGTISLRNSGLIEGDVRFGDASDRYDGRGGAVDGKIYGNGGSDVFIPGMGEETIDGGLGVDTLDLQKFANVRVALDGSQANTGVATGDSYISIEKIIAGAGNDTLLGDAGNNEFFGGAGTDRLLGGKGNDVIDGEAGADSIGGGLGSDQYVFTVNDGSVDTILDFKSVAGNDDAIFIDWLAFDLSGDVIGVVPTANFAANTQGVALDGNDWIIFDTDDRAVWVDPDGTGAIAAVKIATVAGTTPLTADDFFIF